MDRKEDLLLLEKSANKLIELVKRNPHYHKSLGMGKNLSDYTNQLERDIKKYRRRYKQYRPGSIVYVHFGMNFGEEFSKAHYAITLTKNDSKTKRTITVLPLTSKKGKDKVKLDFNFSRELFHLTQQVVNKQTDVKNQKLLKEINDVIPEGIPKVSSFGELSYLFENKQQYNYLIQKVFNRLHKNIELFQIAKEQMDRYERGISKTTYAAVDCITTIDKNKIAPRVSELDVLSSTVLSDKQLKRLSETITDRIIFDK